MIQCQQVCQGCKHLHPLHGHKELRCALIIVLRMTTHRDSPNFPDWYEVPNVSSRVCPRYLEHLVMSQVTQEAAV